jgi:hypothetical protein
MTRLLAAVINNWWSTEPVTQPSPIVQPLPLIATSGKLLNNQFVDSSGKKNGPTNAESAR